MKSTETEAYAYLTVTSQSHSLSDIERSLGQAPDGKSWSIGEPRRPGNPDIPTYDFSRWSLMSGVAKGKSLDAHLAALAERLRPLANALENLPVGMKAHISIMGWLPSEDAPVALRASTLKNIGMVGLPLDFDLYWEDGD